MSFATVAVAALALAAPAAARPRRSSRSTPPPPPSTTIDSGDVNEHHTSSSTSTASCNAEVKASTWSSAQSAYVDLLAEMTLDFCFVSEKFGYYHDYEVDVAAKDGKIKAVAELLLESKLKCDTSGKYAIACARSWAGAYSFAAAGIEAYASAWADGSNHLAKCKCAVDVFASADALTSSWAEIWVAIYHSLDDHVCAQSYDGTADSVKSEINVHCVGNLFLKYWVRAVASVVSSGKCEPEEYLACEACCKNPQGGYIPDCNYEECKTECKKDEHARLIATAYAAINFKEEGGAICTLHKIVDYQKYWYSFAPKYHYSYVAGAEDTNAFCLADAHAAAWAESASAQAVLIKGIWENTCNPLSWKGQGHADFDKTVYAWADAYVKVLAVAHTYCYANGGDADYDGGCATAISYSKAYAAACAEAFAKSFVNFTYGKKNSCKCDIAVSVLSEAIAHEIEIISAFYETEVEARSCTKDVAGTPDYAYIKQECWAKSMADMVARSMAKVSLEGKCAPSGNDKLEYCKTMDCVKYETGDPDWQPCLTECTKKTDAAVTAALEASATISIKTQEYCDGYNSQRFGETYLTKLNGYATSTQTSRK